MQGVIIEGRSAEIGFTGRKTFFQFIGIGSHHPLIRELTLTKFQTPLDQRPQLFGFFPIAGWLGLLGMIIKNVIVLLDEINTQRRNGISPYDSIIEATISRTRPVLMAATTTILGMVPLLFDVAFGGMAATIIFGLTFATLLTLFVTPTLYALFYRIHSPHK